MLSIHYIIITMIKTISFFSRFGWISAVEEKGKIKKIKFSKMKSFGKSKTLTKFKNNLINFFSHKTNIIKAPMKLDGNPLQKKIWKEIIKIKYGKTKSYGEIAKKLQLSPRFVGKVCGQNNLILLVPCHRVLRSDGTLGGFSSRGGIKLKKKLLNFEQI